MFTGFYEIAYFDSSIRSSECTGIFHILQHRVDIYCRRPSPDIDSADADTDSDTSSSDDLEEAHILLDFANGVLVEKSQLNDYALRGPEFADLNYVDFCLYTYDRNIDPAKDDVSQPTTSKARYREGHPSQATRIRIRVADQTPFMPCFVGASFASSTDTDNLDLYHASMLVLYRPWTNWEDVLAWSTNWALHFHEFYDTCDPSVRSQINNTQLRRQASEAADTIRLARDETDETETRQADASFVLVDSDDDDARSCVGDVDRFPAPFAFNDKVNQWVKDGLALGLKTGLLAHPICPTVPRVTVASTTNGETVDISPLASWLAEMEKKIEVSLPPLDVSGHLIAAPSAVIPDFDPSGQLSLHPSITGTEPTQLFDLPAAINALRSGANEKQLLAFDIVARHLHLSLTSMDAPPPQLLMKVLGAPGTGKSWVIDRLSELFALYGRHHMLQKLAHQGSAASNIDGDTVCSWLHITAAGKKTKISSDEHAASPSPRIINALRAKVLGVEYIFIDEISQVRTRNVARVRRLTTLL